MQKNDTAYLVYQEKTQDDTGVWHSTDKLRKVYCKVKSVGQKEWYEGGRSGLNPELQITMFSFDYHGEEIVEIGGRRYTIYRTYTNRTIDEIELYLQFRKGTGDGKTSNN